MNSWKMQLRETYLYIRSFLLQSSYIGEKMLKRSQISQTLKGRYELLGMTVYKSLVQGDSLLGHPKIASLQKEIELLEKKNRELQADVDKIKQMKY